MTAASAVSSFQCSSGSFACVMLPLAAFIRDRFMSSAMLFYCGWYDFVLFFSTLMSL